jgi:hypothetical protein
MARNRIGNKPKNRFRRRVRNVIKGLSRKVLVYKQTVKRECPNCFFDKMTGKSSGKCKHTSLFEADQAQAAWEQLGNTGSVIAKYFIRGRCPVCTGTGYLETQRKTWSDCLVTWDPQARGFGNQMIYTPAGTEGSTVVQLKTHPKNYDLFKNCIRIVVDGVECKLSRPPVMRGLGTQALLIITAFTTEKPKVASSEVIKDYE